MDILVGIAYAVSCIASIVGIVVAARYLRQGLPGQAAANGGACARPSIAVKLALVMVIITASVAVWLLIGWHA
jgi:hypothetical protein